MALQEELEHQGNLLFKYRGTLPVIILLIGIVVYGYYEYMGQTLEDAKYAEIYKYVCLAVGLSGQVIRGIAVGFALPNTSGRNTGEQVADHLNTKGIYSTLRHPLYLGNFLMWLGPAMLTQSFWFIIAFIFIYWVYYERIMFAEEQFLRAKFGAVYLDWASGIPAFVPKFSNYQKNDLGFSWKKVVKQEKNGLLALFLIFFLFEILGQYLREGRIDLLNNYWFYFFVASALFYLVIKFLKSYTHVLVVRR